MVVRWRRGGPALFLPRNLLDMMMICLKAPPSNTSLDIFDVDIKILISQTYIRVPYTFIYSTICLRVSNELTILHIEKFNTEAGLNVSPSRERKILDLAGIKTRLCKLEKYTRLTRYSRDNRYAFCPEKNSRWLFRKHDERVRIDYSRDDVNERAIERHARTTQLRVVEFRQVRDAYHNSSGE